MKNFEEWIDKELYKRGWSRREAARRAGISASMMHKVINREANPGISFFRGIAEAFGVSIVEVLIRAGELKSEDLELEEVNEKYLQLPDWQQKVVMKFIDSLLEEKKGEDENPKSQVAHSSA